MLADVCLALMIAGLTAYALLGGADFGGGFWDLTAGTAGRGARVRGLVKQSLSPVWEANHVWLIFVLVIFWTAFPVAFGSVTSTLSIPLFLAAIGIIFRGTGFALRGEATSVGEERILGGAFAVASLLVPFFLGTVVGGIASGRVPVGNASGDRISSWANPTSVMVGLLAVATGAYLAAVYLAGDAVRVGQPDLVRAFRRRALVAGVVTGALALGTLPVVREDYRPLYDGLTSGGGLAMVIVSALAGLATMVLVWRGRFEWARATAAVAVAAVAVGWALAQRPEFLPPDLTVQEAAAGHSTLVALVIGVAAGLVVLVPSLWYLYRLVLRGQLSEEYHPIGAREERPAP